MKLRIPAAIRPVSYTHLDVYKRQELIFKTRKGDVLHIVTSKKAYIETPFHQQGQLTFQGDRLIRFQYPEGEVTEDEAAFTSMMPAVRRG